MTRLAGLAWIICLIVACRPIANLPPSPLATASPADAWIRDSGEACFQRPYAEDSGIRTGQRAQVIEWNFGLGVRANPDQLEMIGHLNPGERVVVLEGPFCRYTPRLPTHRDDQRLWRVRSETRDLEGWIDEYGWSLITGVRYTVAPLSGDDPGIVIGSPLSQPVQFTGHLVWTDIFGPYEPRQDEYVYTFEDYGYITVALQTDIPDLTEDFRGGTLSCRVIVEMDARQRVDYIEVVGRNMRFNGQPVDRFWIEPGEHHFFVDLRFVPGAGSGTPQGAHPICPDTSYTLTLAPAPGP